MITVFYDWNTASSLTERYDCWRQTLPSRGLAQLDLMEYWKESTTYTKKSTWSAQSVLT